MKALSKEIPVRLNGINPKHRRIMVTDGGEQLLLIRDPKRPNDDAAVLLLRSYGDLAQKFDEFREEQRSLHASGRWEEEMNEMIKLDFLHDRIALLAWVMGADWDDSLEGDKWHFQKMKGQRDRDVDVTVTPEGEYEFSKKGPDPESP